MKSRVSAFVGSRHLAVLPALSRTRYGQGRFGPCEVRGTLAQHLGFNTPMGETRFIRAPYSVLDDGRLYLYEGALEQRCGGAAFTVEGRILLDFAESSLVADYDQPEVATAIMAKSAICNVSLPTDVSIEPPRPPDPMIAMGLSEPVNTVQIGSPNDAERVCAFVFGELTDAVFPEMTRRPG